MKVLGAVIAIAIAAPGTSSASMISPYLVFNRCVGGCTVTGGGIDDARSNASTIPCPNPTSVNGGSFCPMSSGTWVVQEFTNQFGDTGANGHCYGDNGTTACTMNSQCSGTCTGTGSTCAGGTHNGAACTADTDCADICDTADYEWNGIMTCIKEVYSPYAVTVSDTRPAGGVSYTMDMVAGIPENIGYSSQQTGGIAPSIVCVPRDNVISFSFANLNWGKGQDRITTVCGVAAQETAHAFGLDHEFMFVDGTSAGSDPMSYRNDCAGERFFRNNTAKCGEFATRDCVCGGTQNSHAALLNTFGMAMSTVPAPTAAITFPQDGASVSSGWNNAVSAGSRRGVDHVELWVNGYNWAQKATSVCNQPNPGSYSIVAPTAIPDGNQKVVIKAFDETGLEGDATITVHKGAACTADASCLAGQHCNTGAATDAVASGGCFWDPPTGMVGDKCDYPQFCQSGLCVGASAADQICTQHCVPGVGDSCPTNLECDAATDGNSYCLPKAPSGGCCSTGSGPVWPSAGLAIIVLGVVTRRRRQRAASQS
jgi:MYXO-CTERM domain-containing protein